MFKSYILAAEGSAAWETAAGAGIGGEMAAAGTTETHMPGVQRPTATVAAVDSQAAVVDVRTYAAPELAVVVGSLAAEDTTARHMPEARLQAVIVIVAVVVAVIVGVRICLAAKLAAVVDMAAEGTALVGMGTGRARLAAGTMVVLDMVAAFDDAAGTQAWAAGALECRPSHQLTKRIATQVHIHGTAGPASTRSQVLVAMRRGCSGLRRCELSWRAWGPRAA